MNQNDFFEAMRALDEESVRHAVEHKKGQKNRVIYILCTLAACVLLVLCVAKGVKNFLPNNNAESFPQEVSSAIEEIECFSYDRYSVQDYEVPENFMETTKNLYVLGLKCDNPVYQEAVSYVTRMVSDRHNGFSTRYDLSGLDTSLGVICLHFTGTFEGDQTEVDDGLGNKITVQGVSKDKYPTIYFPNIIDGHLKSILCVTGDYECGYCYLDNFECSDIFTDPKYESDEGIDVWREEKRNTEEYYLWQSLSSLTSLEEPMIPIDNSVTFFPGGGIYNVIEETAYRSGSPVSENQSGFSTISEAPAIDFDFYLKQGYEFEVKCWPIGE